MVARKTESIITLTNTVPGTVSIRNNGRNRWTIVQRKFGPEHDNNHNVTWVRINNPGPTQKLRITLKWAEFCWMGLRKFAYTKVGAKYSLVEGTITPTTSVYEIAVPKGESFFGSVPWYTNEDADVFFTRMARNPLCRVESLGKTAEGRDIKDLVIDQPSSRRKKGHVVVLAREHAFESSGSWAVEATARYILNEEAPSHFLRDYTFHIIPIINPDGVANGIKLTRMGPVKEFDLVWSAMAAVEPTAKAYRDALFAMKPVVFLSHHTYLFSMPFVGTYDKRLAARMATELLPDSNFKQRGCYFVNCERHVPFLRYQLYRRFGTTSVVTELPWLRNLPSDIETEGVAIFRAMMKAHEARRKAK